MGMRFVARHVIKIVEQYTRCESKPWPESDFRFFRVH